MKPAVDRPGSLARASAGFPQGGGPQEPQGALQQELERIRGRFGAGIVDKILVSFDGSKEGTRILLPNAEELHLETTDLELKCSKDTDFQWRCNLGTFTDAFLLLADLNQPVALGFYDRASPMKLQSAMAVLVSPSRILPDGTHPMELGPRGKELEEAVGEFCRRLGLDERFARGLTTSAAAELAAQPGGPSR